MATKNPFGYLEVNPSPESANPFSGLGSATATAMLDFLKNSRVKSALEGYQTFGKYKPRDTFATEEEYSAQFGGDAGKRTAYEAAAQRFGGGDEYTAIEKLATALDPWDEQKAERYRTIALQGRAKRENDLRAVLSDYRNEWEKNADQIAKNTRELTDLEYKISSAKGETEKNYYTKRRDQLREEDNAARERANRASEYASETAGRLYGKETAERMKQSMAQFPIFAYTKTEEADETAAAAEKKDISIDVVQDALAAAIKDGSFDYGTGEQARDTAIRDFAEKMGYNVNQSGWADDRKTLVNNLSIPVKSAPKAPTETEKAWRALPSKFAPVDEDGAELLAATFNAYKKAGGKDDAKVVSDENESIFSRLGTRYFNIKLDRSQTFADLFKERPDLREAFIVALDAGKGYADFKAMLPRKGKTATAPAKPAPAKPAPAKPAPAEGEQGKGVKGRLGIKRR